MTFKSAIYCKLNRKIVINCVNNLENILNCYIKQLNALICRTDIKYVNNLFTQCT